MVEVKVDEAAELCSEEEDTTTVDPVLAGKDEELLLMSPLIQ